jgi:C4-dicarboxylate transporter DctM subunit
MKLLDHLEEWLITFLMGAATTIIFVSVAHRYAAGVPIPGLQDWLLSLNFGWAQELCIIMFVWMAKFGAAYGVRTGIHVGVDVLINLERAGCGPVRRLRPACRRAVYRHRRHAGGAFRLGKRPPLRALSRRLAWTHGDVLRGADDPRPRVADLDRLQCHSARFVADVLPLPAGHGEFPATGELPTPRPWPRRRHREEGFRTRCRPVPWKTTCIRTTGRHENIRKIVRARETSNHERHHHLHILLCLMLTGMPISISLGLTVLSFLFLFTQVPLEAVALKLFTGIEKFEIMAIPFFILAGNFPHARRRGATNDPLRDLDGRALVRRPRPGRCSACALFAAVSGSSPATVVAIGSILMPAMVKAGFPRDSARASSPPRARWAS